MADLQAVKSDYVDAGFVEENYTTEGFKLKITSVLKAFKFVDLSLYRTIKPQVETRELDLIEENREIKIEGYQQ